MSTVIEVPYTYKDAWGHEQVKTLRYAREVDPNTHHVRWSLLPGSMGAAPALPEAGVLRVVALGGGTGLPVVLRGLRPYALSGFANLRTFEPANLRTLSLRVEITAVVTMADDGGSSGVLRRQLGVLPPGDVRNCLLALAPEGAPLAAVLRHRFEEGDGLAGHSLGNLFLAASCQVRGGFVEAVNLTGSLLGAVGRVLPSTQEPVELVAEYEDGTVVRGESRIPLRHRRIRRVRVDPPEARPAPEVLAALAAADLIVVGPGSLYTSLVPILLVPGVADSLRASRAARVLVSNLMTQPGETDGYDVADHLAALEAHGGAGLFTTVLVNGEPLRERVRSRYAPEGSYPVAFDPARLGPGAPACVSEDLAAHGDLARHDPDRLAAALLRVAGVPA